MRIRNSLSMISLLALTSTSQLSAQPCTPYWATFSSYNTHAPICSFDDGTGMALYAPGGTVFPAALYPKRRRGLEWEDLRSGWPEFVTCMRLTPLDDGNGHRLYAKLCLQGGTFPTYVWDGAAWHETPSAFSESFVSGLSFDDGTGVKIYAALAYTSTIGAVGRWDGEQWAILGGPAASGAITALVLFDDGSGPALHAAGNFVNLGSSGINHTAKWDGTVWQPLADGPWGQYGPQEIAVATHNGRQILYYQTCPNIHSPYCIQTWDGQSWGTLPNPWGPPNSVTTVRDMEVFNDGTGDSLYIGGNFPMIGGFQANGIARWDGDQWHPVGNGVRGQILTLFAFEDDPHGPSLIISGPTELRPGLTPGRRAQWVGCPNCYANCDQSTVEPRLNVDDFTCFINRFAAQDPYANCDQNAVIDVDDFLCFINRFAQGCP